MYPTLFSFGSFELQTATVFLILAFLLSGFVFWRRGKEEHYSEVQLFDGFVLSYLAGGVLARMSFVAFHFERFGWSLFKWLDFSTNPGGIEMFFLIGSTVFLAWFSSKKKWDIFEMLDFWAISLTSWLLVSNIANFFSGVGRGKFTELPLGAVFPGSLEKSHPSQLYAALGLALILWYLTWSETRYRTFDWYRLGRKAAQTGFLFSNLLIFYSLLSLLLLFFRLPAFVAGGVAWDIWIFLAGLFYGGWLLLKRADKPLIPLDFKKKIDERSLEKFQNKRDERSDEKNEEFRLDPSSLADHASAEESKQ